MQMDFHEMRRQGIGSSDAPVILKVSPWKTPFQLWEEKLGLRHPETSNFATERGIRMEPQARAHYELLNDMEMPATLVEHKEFPFLRASLDGCNVEAGRILEIKCPGQEDHASARAGLVPAKYYPQLQHQLLVTGFERLDYFSFNGTEGALVVVSPDPLYLSMLLEKEIAFWKLVETKIPPELSAGDFRRLKKKGLTDLLRDWQGSFQKLLLEFGDEQRIEIKGVRFRKISTARWEIHMIEQAEGEIEK